MAMSCELSDALTLLHDPEVTERLVLIGLECEALRALLVRPSDHDHAAAQALLIDLHQRLDALERQEREASALVEYNGPDVVWSYALSEPTRACRALVTALEAVAEPARIRAA